jgi:hypothetical protein
MASRGAASTLGSGSVASVDPPLQFSDRMSSSSSRRGAHVVALIAIVVGCVWIATLAPAMAVVLAAVSLTAVHVTSTGTRARIAGYRQRAALQRRQQGRVERLESAGIPDDEVRALTALSTQLVEAERGSDHQLPVDDLLDAFVQLELDRQRCRNATATVARDQLVGELALRSADDPLEDQRRACVAMRLRYWDVCRDHAIWCERALGLIGALVRAYHLRAALPATAPHVDFVQRAVADLRMHDSALAELGADRPVLLTTGS